MKKFVFNFILYIGCLFAAFNPLCAYGEDSASPVIARSDSDAAIHPSQPAADQSQASTAGTFLPLEEGEQMERIIPTSSPSPVIARSDSDAAIHPSQPEQNPLIENHTPPASQAAPSQPAAPENKHRSRSKKITNDFMTFFTIPFVIDKLYPESEINADITPTLKLFYPTTSRETLDALGKFVKIFVSLKRRYDYAVKTLEQKIKAAGIVPVDSPVIAEDGEYAPAYSDDKKQTPTGAYQVGYKPYKYLEYDPGELGEPVRRRDKNYAGKAENLDEIILALLKFDIAGFIKALQKLPRQTDGSDEVSVINEHGVASRLLLGLSAPGNNEKIQGVIQLNIPKDYYINADFLNPRVRPQFLLSEDSNDELNIKEYELFLPEANGVIKEGTAKRILTGTVRYPIEFTRRSIDKPMKIKGSFGFELCHKDNGCRPVADEHELTLPPSLDEELSIYNNYVTQGFMSLPPAKAKHAELVGARYIPESRELELTFKTTQPFSNIAAMAEDADGTNYTAPRYTIAEDIITAAYHADKTPAGQIAVTANFDNKENLRTTITPSLSPSLQASVSPSLSVALPPIRKSNGTAVVPSLPAALPLTFGLLLLLSPGIFYLFVRLTNLLWTRQERRLILWRYSLGSALGLTLLGAMFHGKYWSRIYENVPLTALAGLVVVSMLAECSGRMDFALFRPLRGKLRRGFLIGLFIPLLLTGFPIPYTAPVFSVAFAAPVTECIKILALIWLGMQILPLAALFYRPQAPYFLYAMQRLNFIYNLLYLFGTLYLINANLNETAVWLTLVFYTLVYGFWCIYPMAITETVKHTRSRARQQQLFYKVQRSAAYIILCITVVFTGSLTFFNPIPEATNAPTPTEIIARFAHTEKPIFVTLTTRWSPLTPLNAAIMKRLPAETEVIEIPAAGTARAALPWLKEYNSLYAPLNILYTSRHPHGLKLPADLSNINWQTAFATYDTPQKNERTKNND